MSTSNGGAQDPAVPINVVKGSAMELFAPDPNAAGESVSFVLQIYMVTFILCFTTSHNDEFPFLFLPRIIGPQQSAFPHNSSMNILSKYILGTP